MTAAAQDLLIETGEAGMLYVGKAPPYTAGRTRLQEIPGRYTVVREDHVGTMDCRALGIISES